MNLGITGTPSWSLKLHKTWRALIDLLPITLVFTCQICVALMPSAHGVSMFQRITLSSVNISRGKSVFISDHVSL